MQPAIEKAHALIREAFARRDAELAGKACDLMRFTLGLSYQQQCETVKNLGWSPDDWEEMLYEADSPRTR